MRAGRRRAAPTARRRALLAFPALLALLGASLAGCADVPDDGPVTPAGPLAAPPPLVVTAPRPLPGEAPDDVVRGFLRAGADFGNDHEVAREYLQPDAEWRAEAPVVVVKDDSLVVQPLSKEGTPVPAPSGTASAGSPGAGPHGDRHGSGRPEDGSRVTVRVEAQAVARVDDRGVYTPATGASTAVSSTFLLVARHGEWRISSPPQGLVLTATTFGNYFHPTPLYFPDSSKQWLVPDVRWFPVLSDSTAPAALAVAALLRGPVAWLAGAVQPGGAPGTATTTLAPVRFEGRIARVDLNRAARNATPEQRLLLHAQLVATLQALELYGVPAIDDVVLTQEQARYDVPTGSAPVVLGSAATDPAERAERNDSSARAPLCIDADHVGQLLAAGTVCTPRPMLDALAQPGIRLPASDSAGSVFAVLAAGGTQVLAAGLGKPADVVVRGRNLTAPSVDVGGWVWSVPSSPGGSFGVGGLNRAPVQVSAPWLQGAQVLSLRVSPEGARALVVVRRGGRSSALVAGIRRDGEGRPLALEPDPLDLVPDAVSVVDAGWKDAQTAVVLAARAAAPTRTYAYQVTVGGATTSPLLDQAPADAVGLAVGSDLGDLFVRTASGKAYERALFSWRPINVRDPTLPG